MSGYTDFARVYDALTTNVAYHNRALFLKHLFKQYKINPALVLDLGCGTGSLTILLAQMGYELIGTDISVEMLQVARQKSDELGLNILWLSQPMEKLDLYGTVDAAVCTLDSINHLANAKDVKDTFARLTHFVAPGGLFVFDINTIYKHQEILSGNTFVYDLDELYCVWQCSECDTRNAIEIEINFFEKINQYYRRTHEAFTETAYEISDLRQWLGEAGFKVLTVLDDYADRLVTAQSERALMIAQRI